jgi:hypothetical protein
MMSQAYCLWMVICEETESISKSIFSIDLSALGPFVFMHIFVFTKW